LLFGRDFYQEENKNENETFCRAFCTYFHYFHELFIQVSKDVCDTHNVVIRRRENFEAGVVIVNFKIYNFMVVKQSLEFCYLNFFIKFSKIFPKFEGYWV
jgi:hypothetical protein